ncbi:MAG: hypothetical protein ACTHYN_02070 [Marinobacter sp.]|uniref:hypothetical protein n=1 Tax=Marinobacter sp. TaxID=50741 RepID=UPI003F95A552
MLSCVLVRVVLASLCGLVPVTAHSEPSVPKTQQQQLYEQAERARARGATDKAGETLAGMKEGYWSAIGYLNLSGDYARNDLNPSRALIALRVALAMADKDTDAQRKAALRSRILLRAGYLAFKSSEYEKAIGFFEQMPLDSHRTPQALYFHGLALAEQGNHRAAMQSWHRAKKYPLAYPGVADAWIGMGRGYDLSGYLGQAGEAYLAANAAYEGERVTLRKLAARIEEKGAYKTLVQGAEAQKSSWFLADSRTLAQPRTAYLLSFMEQSAPQQAVNQVVELARMASQLQRNAQDLGVFSAAIANQLETPGLSRTRPGYEALRRANKTLTERLNLLLEDARGNESSAGQVQKLQIMKTTLSDSEQQLNTLKSRLASRSANLKALLAESRQLRKQSLAHLESVAALRPRAEARLDRLALDFVATQDKRMVFALNKTEQQIAHLYEYLALKEINSGEQAK